MSRKADAALQEMSDYLASLEAFRVDTEGTQQVVLTSGQTLSFPFASEVTVRRPNRLRSDRVGEVTRLHFYYDGETFSLYGEKTGYYAQAEAPPMLDDAIDVAREELDVEAPAADLLLSDVHAALLEDVVSGFVVTDDAEIDGTPVVHLAFRGNETDWQIWIEKGRRPLPRRYVITSKNVEGSPEFTVELHDWKTNIRPRDEVFEFTPPKDAKRIEFIGPRPERKA